MCTLKKEEVHYNYKYNFTCEFHFKICDKYIIYKYEYFFTKNAVYNLA